MYLQRNTEIDNPAVFYNLSEAHERLGHSHKDATIATAKAIGMNLKKGGANPSVCVTITSNEDASRLPLRIFCHVLTTMLHTNKP
jgi:hypothetical protein